MAARQVHCLKRVGSIPAPATKLMRLAFFGSPGCGKTTMSNSIAALYGGTVVSFADPLRECVSETFEIPMRDLVHVPEKYQWRQLLQFCGNRMRDKDPNFWVDKMGDHIDSFDPHQDLCIDDMRYPNEFDLLKRLGFEMVHVGSNPSAKQGAITADESKDSSEAHWRDFMPDYYVPWRHHKSMRVHLMLSIRDEKAGVKDKRSRL